MRRRLTQERIEPTPKSVERLTSFRQTCRLRPEQEEFVVAIIEAIRDGRALPGGAYRRSRSRDILLERDGILHLHIGHAGSRELLYLVQYPDAVVLLEISDHYHFTTRPVGVALAALHRTRLDRWEADD